MEEWKLIDNYKYPYYISNKGRIKNRWGTILESRADKDGYFRVRLVTHEGKRHQQMVHRLVAKAFIVGDFSLTVNHIDGNKSNNRLENLEWLSRTDNNKHAYQIGLKNNKGENHGKAHFTEQQVLKIRELHSIGHYKNQTALANAFGTTQARISEIIRRKTWNHI